MKYFLAVLLLTTELHAAPLTIIPNGEATLVTAGIPFAPCMLRDVATFKLVNENGAEVPIFIKPTLFWPATKCAGASTVRAVKIQFAYDPRQGENDYDWRLEARTLPALQEAPVAEIVSENPARDGYKEPAFFAISDPAYLVTTGLISPTTVAGKNEYDRKWYPESFAKRVRTMDFRKTEAADWLFDSVSALYQQALRTGSLEQYREAYLEHEFWISHLTVVSGSLGIPAVAGNPATATAAAITAKPAIPAIADFCVGGFDLSGSARPWSEDGNECDSKYNYLTPAKLHLALTGDDSWTPQEGGVVPSALAKDKYTLVSTIAKRAFNAEWSRTAGLVEPYTNIASGFTERQAGFAIQTMLAAYELTGDPVMLANLTTAVNNLHTMMTDNPDGLGNHGYLSHSWTAHEGWYPGYLGTLAKGVTNSDTITVTNLLGDDWTKLAEAAQIENKPFSNSATLAGPPVLNANGTLTLKLTAPVTMKTDDWITVMSNGAGTGWLYGLSADRVFSPWMQSIIADGLWQFYNLTDDEDLKNKISEMLLGFGRAITAYAIDGNGLKRKTKELIETGFDVKVVSSGTSGSRGIVPYTRYVANYLMSGAPPLYIDYMAYDGAFSDQHSPEALFQISLAIRFETDPAKKAAMQAVASDLTEWFADPGKTIGAGHPARYFNWTNKADAWGTYEAVMQLGE